MFARVWRLALFQINAALYRVHPALAAPLDRLIQRKAATRHAAYIGFSMNTPGTAMNKILVVVYSCTGTSRKVADLLCSQQGWPMAEIVEVRPRAGALGSLRCLLDSLLRRHPPIRYDGPHTKTFGRAPILDAAFTMREVDSGSFATRLEAFGAAVRRAEGPQSTVRPADLSPQAV